MSVGMRVLCVMLWVMLRVLGFASDVGAQDALEVEPTSRVEALTAPPTAASLDHIDTEVPPNHRALEAPSSPPPTLRWLAELGVGLAFMGAASISGYLLSDDTPEALVCAGGLGFLAGFPMAGVVTAVGNAMGGNGGAGWAVLGAIIGGLLSAAVATALFFRTFDYSWGEPRDDSPAATTGGLLAITLLPVLGSVVGYEVSNQP